MLPDYRPAALLALFMFAFGIVAVVSCPYCARADERLPLPDPQIELQPGKMLVVEGVKGRWWPLETALVLKAEHEQYAELAALQLAGETTIELLHQRIEEKDARILNLMTLIDVTKERAEHAESAISHADKARAVAEARLEKSRRWYRHPVFWLLIGVTAGGAAAIAAMR